MEGPPEALEATKSERLHKRHGELLLGGYVTPFLGAGANLCGRPTGVDWKAEGYLPSGAELADDLLAGREYPEGDPRELPRVAQFVDVMHSRLLLNSQIRQSLAASRQAPNALHRFLARLPALMRGRGHGRHPLIVTTNYDDALERAFSEAGESFDLLTYAAFGEDRGHYLHTAPGTAPKPVKSPKRYMAASPDARTVIVKVHGTLDKADAKRDSFVISEDDFIKYMVDTDVDEIPANVKDEIVNRHLLFLGYSLGDWNLRVFLERFVHDRTYRLDSWAVMKDPKPLEPEFWRRREVQIVNEPLEGWLTGVQTWIDNATTGPAA